MAWIRKVSAGVTEELLSLRNNISYYKKLWYESWKNYCSSYWLACRCSDYPAEKEIGLLPVNTDSIATVALTGLSENLYELQLLQSQVQLAERQKRLISNGYIPSLNLTGNWRFAAYTDEAYHWFHSGPSNHWFRSYGVGLTLRIPIFDGLDKYSKHIYDNIPEPRNYR